MEKTWIKDGEIWDGKSIVLDGMRIFNPSDEQLIAAGYEIYVKPEPTITELIDIKISELMVYDISPAVNEFFIDNAAVWLDKSTRAGLLLRIDAEIASHKEFTTLWYNGISYTISINKAKQMLYDIEIYASACYDNTEQHKASIQQCTTKEEVDNYDFTIGYPEKLQFFTHEDQ